VKSHRVFPLCPSTVAIVSLIVFFRMRTPYVMLTQPQLKLQNLICNNIFIK